MKNSKIAQTYIGLISVFTLVIIGSGVYLLSSGILSSSADSIANSGLKPSVTITADSSNLEISSKGSFYLKGDFSKTPVKDALMTISFPKDIIEVQSISTQGGILGKAKDVYANQSDGMITLSFNPLTKSDSIGPIAKVNYIASQAGEGKIDFLSLETTLTSGSVIPDFSGLDLTIK